MTRLRRWLARWRPLFTGAGSVVDLSGRGTYRALRAQSLSAGGRIPGDWYMNGRDMKPLLLSRGHVAISRAEFDRVGVDGLAALNAGAGRPPVRPDITIVEPDGTLTQIDGG